MKTCSYGEAILKCWQIPIMSHHIVTSLLIVANYEIHKLKFSAVIHINFLGPTNNTPHKPLKESFDTR